MSVAVSEPAVVGENEIGRLAGKVKWFNAAKGYGFITGDSGTEYFVHFSSIDQKGYRELHESQSVTFVPKPGKGEGRWAAGEVRPA